MLVVVMVTTGGSRGRRRLIVVHRGSCWRSMRAPCHQLLRSLSSSSLSRGGAAAGSRLAGRPAAALVAAAGGLQSHAVLGGVGVDGRRRSFSANSQQQQQQHLQQQQPGTIPQTPPPPSQSPSHLPPRRVIVPPPPPPPLVDDATSLPPLQHHHHHHPAVPLEHGSRKVSVQAVYVGQRIDLTNVLKRNFLGQRNACRLTEDALLVPLARDPRDKEGLLSALVVCRHGSVVFFNVDAGSRNKYISAIRKECGEVAVDGAFSETLECRLRPGLGKYHEMGQDVINIRELNEDTIKVISDVIGHSVALNFYNQKADRMLEDFRTLNNAVEGSGRFTEMNKRSLFKLVAMNNKILTDAMSSGLLEQTKPAWNFNRFDLMWNDLRHEFSIGDRFGKVEHKINHVQSNTKFFLEILNHQKSNNLEWVIVILIGIEIVLSAIDLYHQDLPMSLIRDSGIYQALVGTSQASAGAITEMMQGEAPTAAATTTAPPTPPSSS